VKYFILLGMGLLTASISFADYVYMKENEKVKSVMLKVEGQPTRTLNNSQSKSWAIYPDISSDGNELLYSEGEDANDLHLTYFNKKKNLTQKFYLAQKGMLLHPKLSKNGQWIFYSAPGPQGKNVIYFFDRAAEVARQGENLTHFSLEKAKVLSDDEAYFPRPSSDGNFIIYQRNLNGKKEIILFDRLENQKKVLSEGMSPALSFDEKLIAFTSKKDGHWNIYVIDRTNGEITQKTHDPKDEMAPTFLPDQSIVFASNQTGRFRLFHLKKNKTEWHPLENISESEKADFYSPQFSGETSFKQELLSPFIGNPRSSFGTVAHEGKIYMAGGHQGAEHTYPPESFSDMLIVYDIESNSWKELAPRPVKAHGYQLAAKGNYVYAFGGFSYSELHKPKWKSLDQIDRYDIKKNKWETIGILTEPRSSNVAVTLDDKVYLVGGWNSTPKFQNDFDGKFLDSIEVFDLLTEKIEVAPFKMPLPLRRALTGIDHDGKILLIGGLGEGASHFELLNKVTAINPQDGSSQELTPLPFATFAPAAGILKNELMVFGGMFKTGPMNYEYVSHVYSMNMKDALWRHTGRYLKETKGFSQVFNLNETTLGVLGGHHYLEGMDSPVSTFETITKP
jgi:Tol biopolymer transport system component/N-acetylneuraminic acid mutarotase